MKLHKTLNQQTLAREIASRSRYQRYWQNNITEAEANRFLYLLFDILEETLSTPGGKVSIDLLGIFEVASKKVGGSLKQGDGAAETVSHEAQVIRFRPAKHIKEKLKENSKYIAQSGFPRGER